MTLLEAALLVVYATGNVIVMLAVWYRVRPASENPYQDWLDKPDATTHTTLGKLL